MLLSLYRMVTHLGGPLIAHHVRRRARRGKEDPARIGERFGRPGLSRPEGRLVWVHAASVGEALAALPLVDTLLKARPALRILMTTGTVTSAELMAKRLPEGVLHQFVPIDRGDAWRSFLTHWRPDLGCLIESEIWPNLVFQAQDLEIPLALVNGRMSSRSFGRWQMAERAAKHLFSVFELCLARSDEDAERFRLLGAQNVRSLGDLKHAAPPLPVDEDVLATWRSVVEKRTLWLAASTHPGEEEKIIQVHKSLTADFPKLLTMIVPRHPERGDELAKAIKAAGLDVALRSKAAMPGSTTDIYLGDSIGELGLFYRLAPIAFIGGSLVPQGGQNPLEAARLGCALLFGPHTENFSEITELLEHREAAKRILNADDLSTTLRHLFNTGENLRRMIDHALHASETEGAALDRIVAALLPLLDRKTQQSATPVANTIVETADASP